MREDTRQLVGDFLEFLKDELDVSELPKIEFVGKDFSDMQRTFGQFDGKTIKVVLQGRHPMDVLRTLAHEVVHQVKNHTDGSDGSDDENEANAMAGKFMRMFGKNRSDGFGLKAEGISLRTFVEALQPGPEGFEVAHQGVVRRSPGEGPDSTADAQEMVATDQPQNVQPRIGIDIVPNGVSPDDVRAMFRPLLDMGLEDIYERITSAGAYGRVEMSPEEAEKVSYVVGQFLDTRRYDKPKKLFAQDVSDQLGSKLNETPRMVDIFEGDVIRFPSERTTPGTDLGKNAEVDDIEHARFADYLAKVVGYLRDLGNVPPNKFDRMVMSRDFRSHVHECFEAGLTAAQCFDDINISYYDLFESLSGVGENEQGFERQDMVRRAPELAEADIGGLPKSYQIPPDAERDPDGYIVWDAGGMFHVAVPTAKDPVQSFTTPEKRDQYLAWHRGLRTPTMREVFIREISGKELKKSSEKERREHPWATAAQAKRIALDHAKEEES